MFALISRLSILLPFLMNRASAPISHLTFNEIVDLDFSNVPAGAHPSVLFVIPEQCESCPRFHKLLRDFAGDSTFMGAIFLVNSSRVPWELPVFAPVVLLADSERRLPYCGPSHFMHLMDAVHQFSNGVRAARLDDSNFEHDTQASSGSTTGDWLIIFDTLSEPVLRMYDGLSLSLRVRGVSLGVLDPVKSHWTAKRFGVSIPSSNLPVMFMLHRSSVFWFTRPFSRTDFDRIMRFAIEEFHSHSKSVVPRPRMYFDAFVDWFVDYYKAMENNYGTNLMLIVFVVILLFSLLFIGASIVFCFWLIGSFDSVERPDRGTQDIPHEAGDDAGVHLSKKSKRE